MYRLTLASGPANPGPSRSDGKPLEEPFKPPSVRRTKPPHRLDSRINTSPLRPHVFARERFTSWRTPYSITFFHLLSQMFPPDLIDKWRMTVEASVDEGTLKNYAAGLIRFTQFCDKYGLAEDIRMPANE